MRMVARVVALLLALTVGAWAQMGQSPGWPVVQPAPSSGCSQATTFLARTSGLSGTESSAYTTMICGMVTDGTWALMDVLYIFATNNTTTAALNLVSTSFTAATNGAWSFTADRGWTGGGGNNADNITTGYVPSIAGGNMTLNSASLGVYSRTSRTASTFANIGAQNVGNSSVIWLIQFFPSPGNVIYDTNANSLTSASATNAQGMWVQSRTASNLTSLYQNASTTTPIGTQTTASVSLVDNQIYIGAVHDSSGGVPPASSAFNSTDEIAAAFIAGGLTGAQALSVSNRINAYMTSVGANVY